MRKGFTPLEISKSPGIDYGNTCSGVDKKKRFLSLTGFTLVEIMIVVAIIAVLAMLAIPNVLRARMTANESAAKATIQSISNAYETYATANNGVYPDAETDLLPVVLGGTADPSYLNAAYDGQTINGYIYDLTFNSATTYTITATPSHCNTTGETIYTITNGVLTETSC